LSAELEKAAHWEGLDKVIQLYLEGNTPPMIAKRLGLRVKDVDKYVEEWRFYVRNNSSIQDRARDSIHNADAHFDKIIRELWQLIEDADDNLSAKNTALKTIADTEVKRTQMLEKAGLTDNEAMADLIVENEKKVELVVNLLKTLAADCEHCRPLIINGLSKMSGEEPVVIRQDFIDVETEEENGS